MNDFIPYGRHHIDESDVQAVVEVLRNGWLTQGPMVEAFEQAVVDYTGARYAVAVANGTAALHLAALAADVNPGKTLVTSALTFVASANCALYAGAQPAFTDIDPQTVNMSVSSLAEVVERNPNTAAVVPVHFAGLPCDMPAIQKIADHASAVIIEDASHALGSSYVDGSRVGSCPRSHMTVLSFHPVKAIAAGEGGMITTNDENLYRKLLRLRSHGINKSGDNFQSPQQAVGSSGITFPWYYEMQELGYNYRITDIQCALARSQLSKLDQFIARRRELVKIYDQAFAEFDACRPAQPGPRDQSGHHLYVLRIDFVTAGWSREELMLELKQRGIGSQVHYIPVPMQPYYQRLGFHSEDYPNAHEYYGQALSIPLYYDLTDEQQQLVIATLRELLN